MKSWSLPSVGFIIENFKQIVNAIELNSRDHIIHIYGLMCIISASGEGWQEYIIIQKEENKQSFVFTYWSWIESYTTGESLLVSWYPPWKPEIEFRCNGEIAEVNSKNKDNEKSMFRILMEAMVTNGSFSFSCCQILASLQHQTWDYQPLLIAAVNGKNKILLN